MLGIVIGAIAMLACAVIAYLVRDTAARNEQALAAVRNDVNLLRETSDKQINQLTGIFGNQLTSIGDGVRTSLESVRGELNSRLTENARAMTEATQSVTTRVASVQSTFAELQKQVGEITAQAQQLAQVTTSIHELQHILTAPKLRGGLGEAQLENLLAQVFPRDSYEIQYRFASSGEAVDAVLKFPQGLVAIDSKFPLENFKRIASADTDEAKKGARREFIRDVRKHIEAISTKYIRPADGTLPFALMYIPAENVYYEAIIRDDEGSDLYQFGVDKHVMPVSPNSLYAYLYTIIVGLKSMRINERAATLVKELQSLDRELDRFQDSYRVLGTHIKNAGKSYDEAQKALDKVDNRLEQLSGNGTAELAGEEKKAIGAARG